MNKFIQLSLIGFIAGVVLMLILKIVMMWTGNPAYILLFNFDYIPIVKDLKPEHVFGYIFHFTTCIVSVIALYFILKQWNLEHQILPYILVYGIGGGVLFFLTSLSPKLPEANDWMAWFYWTLAHIIYAFVVALLIKKYLGKKSIQFKKS